VKKIAFLSFGQWNPRTSTETRSAADALAQSIDLAVAAEELGADGAYFRVHHFVEQVTSPFPLMAAIGRATRRIEVGMAVIDMRCENPLYMAELAATTDLIAGGRLQLGLARGVVIEQTPEGYRHFGYNPPKGASDADMARDKTERLPEALSGQGFARPSMRAMFPYPPGRLRIEPHSPGLSGRIWWDRAQVPGSPGRPATD
jgi:alkanesulfonate monooxygenase SsuD/methylene tetrahydromethanopterin reductase-like flavin-dependent oxidoreductase (luciferase family)